MKNKLLYNIQPKHVFVFYCIAVVFTDVVPSMGGVDVMGAQWLYLAVINFLGLAGLYFTGRGAFKPIGNKLLLTVGVVMFFFLLSVFSAINKTESLVVLSRYVTVFFTVFLFYQFADISKPFMMSCLGWSMGVICCLESAGILSAIVMKWYQSGGHKIPLKDILTADWMFKQGNKNISASNLLQKLPFVFILLWGKDKKGVIFGYIVFLITCIAIFIINARSAYIGLGLLILLVNIFLVARWIKTRKYSFSLLFFNVFFLVGLFGANKLLGHFKGDVIHKYGGVFNRAGSILETGQNPDSRLFMWAQAFDCVKKHPLAGCGIGNWKITAIDYDKYKFDDFRIAKHAHNDFLEVAAETGIAGGLAYLFLFVFLLSILTVVLVRSKPSEDRWVNVVCFSLLAVIMMYMTDALFNFPAERPCNQINFAIAAGLAATLPLAFFKNKVNFNSISGTKQFQKKIVFSLMGVTCIALIAISSLIFKSMRFQLYFSNDYVLQKPLLNPDIVASGLGNFPDLTEYCLSVSCIKARYYLVNNRVNEAFGILDREPDPNPNFAMGEALKAEYYASLNKYDSSLPHAKRAIEKLPCCRSYYRVFIYGCVALKDTCAIRGYFPSVIKHTGAPKAAKLWFNYASAWFECTANKAATMAVLDSGLATYPTDPSMLKLKVTLNQYMPSTSVANDTTQKIGNTDQSQYQNILDKANIYFKNKQYDSAIRCFSAASKIKPFEYANYENLGLLCLLKYDNQSAASYFKKVIDAKVFKNGKAEYYYAVALVNMNQKDKVCEYIKVAVARQFPGAQELKVKYCK